MDDDDVERNEFASKIADWKLVVEQFFLYKIIIIF